MVGPVSFVRTVLGDIDPSELGVTYAHEHLVIDGGRPVADGRPTSTCPTSTRWRPRCARRDGARTAVPWSTRCPATPAATPAKLAELARRTGVNIVAPTGLHHERFYGPAHWSHRVTPEDLAELFVADITEGIDAARLRGPGRPAHGTIGPGSSRSPAATAAHRHATPRVRGGRRGASTDRAPRSSPIARPAPARSSRSGAPDRLRRVGPGTSCSATSTRSSTATTTARSCATGAFVEYDQSFRWGDAAERDARAARAGWPRTGCSTASSLGMDAARQGYYSVYGGAPGLGWLLDGFSAEHGGARARCRGRHRHCSSTNPARAFAFARPTGGSAMTESLRTSVVGLARAARHGSCRASQPRSAASSARSISRRCSTMRSTSRCATRRRPASTS